jgi:hypothetical protein
MPPDRHMSGQPDNQSASGEAAPSGGSASAEHGPVAIDTVSHGGGSQPVLAKPRTTSREIVAGLCLAPVLFIAGTSGIAMALGFSPLDVVTLFRPNAERGALAVASVPPQQAPSLGNGPAAPAMPDFSVVDEMLASEASRSAAKTPPVRSDVQDRLHQPAGSPPNLPISDVGARAMPSAALSEERAAGRLPPTPADPVDASAQAAQPDKAGAVAMLEPTPVIAAKPQPLQEDASPSPPFLAKPQARRLSSEEIDSLRLRAEKSIEQGDISGARPLLERAAEAEDVGSILLLAQTYDPSQLARWRIRGIRPDPDRARQLYERAKQFGSEEAEAFAKDLMRSGG